MPRARWLWAALVVSLSGCAADAKNQKKNLKARAVAETMTDCTKTVGSEAAANLAEVIEQLADGAVLCLREGTYALQAVLSRPITLRGVGGADKVILDGRGEGSVLRINESAQRVVIEQLTITGGAAVTGGGAISGAAEAITLREVVLRGNRADGESPGAALALHAGTATLERCRIVDNRGHAGAVAYLSGSAKVTLRDCLVTENHSDDSLFWVHQFAQLRLEHCTLAANQASAAIELRATPIQTPTLVVEDSVLEAAPTAIANGPRLPGKATVARSLVDGEQIGVSDGGGNRSGKAGFTPGDDPLTAYRPPAGSAAAGIARPGVGPDLAGAAPGTTAGALQAK